MTTEFKIKVESDFPMLKNELYNKLKNWLEHNAHTSSNFGFTLHELSYLGREEQ